MPNRTEPYSFEIISPDGKGRVKVTYPPGSDRNKRRALRKEARREFFRLYYGDKTWRSKKGRKKKFHINTITSRYRNMSIPNRYITPDSGRIFRLGIRKDVQNGKVFQTLPVTNGGFGSPPAMGRECWDQVNPGPPFHTVGPFKLIQYEVPGAEYKNYAESTGFIQTSLPGEYSTYSGGYQDNGFWIADSFGPYSSASLASFPTLSAYHSLAWDSLKPKVPAWNATQFIYELRDLPGQLKTTAELFGFRWRNLLDNHSQKWFETPRMNPSFVGDQFLNEEFGWTPFISDLMNLIKAYENTAKYMSDMVRQNRTWMKRRRVLEETEVVSPVQRFYSSATIPSDGATDWKSIPMCRPFNLDGNLCRGFTDFQKIVKTKVWGTGSFMYYRPEFDSMDPNFDSGIMILRRYLTMYGFRINPSVLYKITPWTWLVDWFTNMGKHVDRLNDFVEDGIVSSNLSVCRSEERTITKTCFLNYYQNPVTVQFQRRLLLKQRELADSPYGFNSPWNEITPRKAAILAAIGISRSGSGFKSRGA